VSSNQSIPTAAPISRRIFCVAVAAFMAVGVLAAGHADDVQIDAAKAIKVKAAYLLNFVRFTQWPDTAFASPQSPLVVAVVGDDPFGEVLETTFEGKNVGDRKVEIRRFPASTRPTRDQLRACHLLFVASSESTRLKDHLAAVDGAPTLTVSDLPGFTAAGGMIDLILTDGKVAFQINRKAAEAAMLKLSAKLLQLGKVVEANGKGG